MEWLVGGGGEPQSGGLNNVSCIYISHIGLNWAPLLLQIYCIMQLASRVAVYSHVLLCQRAAEPITNNWSTCGHLTWLANKPQQKQTEQLLALIHTWIVSGLMWLFNGESWIGALIRSNLDTNMIYMP